MGQTKNRVLLASLIPLLFALQFLPASIMLNQPNEGGDETFSNQSLILQEEEAITDENSFELTENQFGFGNSTFEEELNLSEQNLEENEARFGNGITVFEPVQKDATINMPVLWTQRILSESDSLLFEIPLVAEILEIKNSQGQILEPESIVELYNSKLVALKNASGEINVKYRTPAPKSSEEIVNKGVKEITISSEIEYWNVRAYSALPIEVQNNGSIRLFDEETDVPFQAFDADSNGLYDIVEWKIPRLEQSKTYQLILNSIRIEERRKEGSNWIIRFDTTGKANLSIMLANTTNQSFQFAGNIINKVVMLYCGESRVSYDFMQDDSIYVEDFSCEDTAKLVLKIGVPDLKFVYGEQVAYSYNNQEKISFSFQLEKVSLKESSLSTLYTISSQEIYSSIDPNGTWHYYMVSPKTDAPALPVIQKTSRLEVLEKKYMRGYIESINEIVEEEENQCIESGSYCENGVCSDGTAECTKIKVNKTKTISRFIENTAGNSWLLAIKTRNFDQGSFNPSISGCGNIVSSGQYWLTGDISINGATCLTVQAP
ncbi:MAG: hypothetical protein QW275_01405, partial [Candidatus Anstonellaceae archaeon]